MAMVTAMPRAGLPVLSAIPVPGNRPVPPSDSAGASLPDPRPWLCRRALDPRGRLRASTTIMPGLPPHRRRRAPRLLCCACGPVQ